MRDAVIENWDGFVAYLNDQPLCRWASQKQNDLASGKVSEKGRMPIHAPPKNDNADLAAALSSMA